MTETTTIKIAAQGRRFGRAVSEAKGHRGTFDAKTKTWSLSSGPDSVLGRMAANYNMSIAEYANLKGWALVETAN